MTGARLWAALAAMAAAMLGAEGAAAASAPKPLFANQQPIHIIIQAPFDTLTSGGRNADKSVSGTLSVQDADKLPVTLSLRGITRRRKDVCAFPPLRVEFNDKPGAASVFKGQKKLKLVTHCRSAESFQQYVLLEYAAYRLYNQLTPASFNARLVNVDYVDERGKPIISRLGFFIEDADDVAERNGLKEIKTPDRIPVERFSPPDAARFVLFEDFIGNLDFAMTAGPAGDDCCHNSRPIAREGATTGLIPVPYDFDFAGMVDAPYAATPAEIPLPNVRIRRYRGYCRHNAEATAYANEMLARRGALLAVLDEVPQLDPKSRAKARNYLDGFFEQIDTPEHVAKLLQGCMGPS